MKYKLVLDGRLLGGHYGKGGGYVTDKKGNSLKSRTVYLNPSSSLIDAVT